MLKIETKKFIALYTTIIFGILALLGFYLGKQLPSDYVTVFGMIVAFYFGAGKGHEQK